MALKRYHKNLPLLFGAGAICLLYGLGAMYIEKHFTLIPFIILSIGLVCTFVVLFVLKKNRQKIAKASIFKKYSFVVFILLLSGTVLVGINYLAYKYNLRWDLTKVMQHTLTDSTTAFVGKLKQDIKVTVFYVGIPPKYLEDLLREYERLSSNRIKSEIIDPIVQIGYAAQFGNVIKGNEQKVIVQSSNERKDIDFTDQLLTEDQLNNAIIQVARDKRTVYFLRGHGEYDISDETDKGLSILKKTLIANNVEIKKLMLGTKEAIPDDCDVFIIAGPKNSLTEEEEQAINKYLENGGDALFLIENTPITTPDKPLTEIGKAKNPSLNTILNHWGINIADDIVVDLNNNIGDVGCPATRNYMEHKAIVAGLDYTFYIRPRSISVLGNRRKSIKLAPLVLTDSGGKSWAETNRTLNVQYDEGIDRPGPIPIAFVIWEPKGKTKSTDTRIIVFTDTDFLTNVFISKYSNAEMGLNSINWLSELEHQIFIDPKEIKIERLDLTTKQKRVVSVILFFMPVLIAILGIITWIKQKD